MTFWKIPKVGRGVIFNPKIDVADFGNFEQGFLNMKLIQKEEIQGSGYVFFNNCIGKNQNKAHLEEGMCMRLILSGPYTSSHIYNHIHYKKFAT